MSHFPKYRALLLKWYDSQSNERIDRKFRIQKLGGTCDAREGSPRSNNNVEVQLHPARTSRDVFTNNKGETPEASERLIAKEIEGKFYRRAIDPRESGLSVNPSFIYGCYSSVS